MPAIAIALWAWSTQAFAADNSMLTPDAAPRKMSGVVSGVDILLWSLGLIFVLALFFCCVWLVRRLGGVSVNEGDKMRILGGLSLGLREKVILLQVGKKQLVLGVTRDRIQTLLVLEGEDCLKRDDAGKAVDASAFGQKLVQALKSRPDE